MKDEEVFCFCSTYKSLLSRVASFFVLFLQKPKVAPEPPRLPPPKVKPKKPINPRCSLLGDSCVPHTRCCDPFVSCHCRFFNAICYCRRTNPQCRKKT